MTKILSSSIAPLAAACGLAGCATKPSTGQAVPATPAVVDPEPAAPPKPAKAPQPAIKAYPLDTCIVSDEGLESMGGSITRVYGGREVKFCCGSCVEEFEESPSEFLAKLP